MVRMGLLRAWIECFAALRGVRVRPISPFATVLDLVGLLGALFGMTALLFFAATPARAAEDPLATTFGTMSSQWDLQLSPDGTRVSFLQMHSEGMPIAAVYDLESRKSNLVLASEKDRFDVNWCRWANNERLLCGFGAVFKDRHLLYRVSRLVAVNADGTQMKVLMQRRLDDTFAQFQDDVVDWLPDDAEHVLIEKAGDRSTGGTGVAILDIYTGRVRKVQSARKATYDWITDGRGAIRLRLKIDKRERRWDYRLSGEKKWHLLDRAKHTDFTTTPSYQPVGFGEDPNQLLVLKPHEGRLSLWSEDLSQDRQENLVFSHPEVDASGVLRTGRFKRVVAVGYSTDRNHYHFFDTKLQRIVAMLTPHFVDQEVRIVDENGDARFYIVHVSSDRKPGVYYRFDAEKKELSKVTAQYPALEGLELAPMTPIRYAARDGVEIPAYLTIPPSRVGNAPAIVLPHGGPQSRDYWGYDWLSQFLAARGFVVLQSNYRGSGGYGEDWAGDGGFRNWRLAIDDITDGARYLVQKGIADPARICVLGWSYGGYAALLSAAEHPDLYRCVVSIAGVTDLPMLIDDARGFVAARITREFVGQDRKVLVAGSPARRADEIRAPVLLFHGDEDVNVSIEHSEKMERALKKADKSVEFIEYEEVEHSLRRNQPRIDMLRRIGAFLDRHTQLTKQAEPARSP
jgi:dipeptidyl aminopeptidase/acylaminoacyl peptidase